MSATSRTVLITGAGGFVGRHLIAELERQTEWNVLGLALHLFPAGQRTRVLTCDLRNAELLGRVIERHRPDAVVHLAAQSYVPKAFASPGDTIANNVTAQVNLLECCRSIGIDPLILIIGSAEQYGMAHPDEMPLSEDQPFRPMNPYAVSKIAQDMLGLQYFLTFGMRIVRIRPFNHFGPGQSDRFVLSNFARQVAEVEQGRVEPVVLTGNLEARRDFLDVRDVVRAYRLAFDYAEPGEVYNLASGHAYRIGDMLDKLLAFSTASIEVRNDPARMRPSDVPVHVGDASRFRAATGWEPTFPIDVSLRDTLEDWRSRLAAYVDET
jgi:GDP-4-dehydro-6-deoxy-D-mannose reductase